MYKKYLLSLFLIISLLAPVLSFASNHIPPQPTLPVQPTNPSGPATSLTPGGNPGIGGSVSLPGSLTPSGNTGISGGAGTLIPGSTPGSGTSGIGYSQLSATCVQSGDLFYVICVTLEFLRALVPILLGLGIIYFIWGVLAYVIAGGEEAKKKGKDKILFGLLGILIIVGLWGIIGIVMNTFDLSGTVQFNPNQYIPNQGTSSAGTTLLSCTLPSSPKFNDLVSYITCIIATSIIPLIFTLAVVAFLWGVVQYVINDTEEAKKAKGKQFMIWGIVALTVMVSVWGLVQILSNTFGINFVIPQLQT